MLGLGPWRQVLEWWRPWRTKVSAGGTVWWDQHNNMLNIIWSLCLRPRSFLLNHLLWLQPNWKMRKLRSQRSPWEPLCTWVAGVPTKYRCMDFMQFWIFFFLEYELQEDEKWKTQKIHQSEKSFNSQPTPCYLHAMLEHLLIKPIESKAELRIYSLKHVFCLYLIDNHLWNDEIWDRNCYICIGSFTWWLGVMCYAE